MIQEKNKKIWTVFQKDEELFLRTKTKAFSFAQNNKKEREELVQHMRVMMVANRGVGLSENQIGINAQVFVAQLPDDSGKGYAGKFYAIFNPRIVKKSLRTAQDQEGCLSVPDMFGEVARHKSITIEGFDVNEKPTRIVAKGFLARIFQHEIDHLNGIVFTDKAHNVTSLTELLENNMNKSSL